ncbi:MAG: hypothetical protein IT487_15040 [Chromatiaceae bacterium]|nr:hypothetical protein [Chromatiaceae bacterium]
MTAITHRPTKTPLALLLALGGILACASGTVQASKWKNHATDAALEAAQITAPEPVLETMEAVDAVRDSAASASGVAAVYGVAGNSAPVILGSLKAVGGPVAVGAVSGFGVAGLQSKILYSECDNANACDAAAYAGYAGAGAGTLGAAALGVSYGVGASGLATIGGLVGGGMAAGAIGLIALPAAGAILIGAAVYGTASLLTD